MCGLDRDVHNAKTVNRSANRIFNTHEQKCSSDKMYFKLYEQNGFVWFETY